MELGRQWPRLATVGLLAVAAAACATPPSNATLEQARTRVSTVASDPTVNREAPIEAQRARESLSIAEAAWSDGASQPEVTHRAYLAMQRANLADATAKLRVTQAEIQNAGADLDRARLSAAEARNEQLRRELEELEARPTPRGQVVTLSNVLFKIDSAELIPGATPTLDQLAGFLRRYPDYRVAVEGHTDNTGSSTHNADLSQRRAEAVRSALVRRGIDPSRVYARGMGEDVPVASNDTPQGRQLNRRVELVLTSPTAAPTSASGAPTSPGGTTGTASPPR